MLRRILAVDDNEIVGWTLAARLWVGGYDVETVKSASEAFLALAERSYDLVLMDLDMPDMSGLDAVEHIVKNELCVGVPILFLTSSEDFAHVQRAYGLGAKGYLTKTSATPALIRAVKRLIDERDVIWIDDHHCVSKRLGHEDRSLVSEPPVRAANEIQVDRRPLPALRLVPNCGDPIPKSLSVC